MSLLSHAVNEGVESTDLGSAGSLFSNGSACSSTRHMCSRRSSENGPGTLNTNKGLKGWIPEAAKILTQYPCKCLVKRSSCKAMGMKCMVLYARVGLPGLRK